MDRCRAAEHALVAALALGQADPVELTAHVRVSDFADPVAGLLFELSAQAACAGGGLPAEDLPRLLRSRGALREDGYPLRELLEWLPGLPLPAHPGPWAALVVGGALGRLVGQCGERLVQVSEAALEGDRGGAGRVLAVSVAQRAAVQAGVRRWRSLPARWRAALPEPGPAAVNTSRPPEVRAPVDGRPPAGVGDGGYGQVEWWLLSSLVAAPQLGETMRWLHATDFDDPDCAAIFAAVSTLQGSGRPVDLVTVAAALPDRASLGVRRGAASRDGSDDDWGSCLRAIDPRLGQPGSASVWARQVVTGAVLRQAQATGGQLLALAGGSPSGSGGIGGPVLERALGRLDELLVLGRRWQQAHVRPTGTVSRPNPALGRPSLTMLRPTLTCPPAGADRTAG